ncbi:unnamed protein product, partial [Mesorhabditis belari]|uniref:Uncharacterized protein n=1 Tax=Mesorhabditis belari TaxID=2138241 RepID=A0AAF3FCD3_9BILA
MFAKGLTKIQTAVTSPERTFDLTEEMKNTNRMNVTGTAVCKDSQIAGFLNYAMSYYIHNMDGLSSYVLDQIQRARKPGKWLVHSQIIATGRQGPDWQTKTNGDVFSQPPNNWYACYYHDTQTYILVLRLY